LVTNYIFLILKAKEALKTVYETREQIADIIKEKEMQLKSKP
jgi:hypothetical protein